MRGCRSTWRKGRGCDGATRRQTTDSGWQMTGALRTLLTGLIDYAGLFAPAALPMTDAVGNYASYRDGADAWALARFVVPVVRLGEFEAAATPHLGGAPWRLTVLAQASDADTIRSFNARHAGRAQIEAVESAVTTLDDAGLVM